MNPGEMKLNDFWAVEYNPLARTLTIALVENILRENRLRFLYGSIPHRILLGIFPTSEEATEAMFRIRDLLPETVLSA